MRNFCYPYRTTITPIVINIPIKVIYGIIYAMFKFHLRKLLYDKKWTQRKLSQETGVRGGTINAYFNGYIKRMNVDDLIKICDSLECSLNELLEYVPDKKKEPISKL